MFDLTPFDYERLVLAYLITYKEAANYVLPELTQDKFLYSKEGRLDSSKDHRSIFQAITYVHLVDKLPITVTTVLQRLGAEGEKAEYLHYLSSLQTALHGYYRIREFDPRELMLYAEMVDKAGVIYQASVNSLKLAAVLDSPEAFARAVSQIEDVTSWLQRYTNYLSTIATPKAEGYTHISTSVERAMKLADGIYSGEQVMYLPTGMPSIVLPTGKLIVLQGESKGGKSIVTHQICLGTAIGLKQAGVEGCVAINSLEEREGPFTLKLASMLAGVDMWKFQYLDGITQREKDRLDRALEYVATLPIYLDTTNLLSTSVLDYRLTGLHSSDKGPVHLMSVDYLGRMDLDAEGQEIREQNIDKAVNHFADISGSLGITIILIVQVTQGNSGDYKSRIAGADGTRGSRSIRFACDMQWEWWNPIHMRRSGTNITIPDHLNDKQPFLLSLSTRGGPLADPVPFIWQPEYQRVGDTLLNREGLENVVLFSHPLPDFDEPSVPQPEYWTDERGSF